jgi:hypothetical protein
MKMKPSCESLVGEVVKEVQKMLGEVMKEKISM